MARDEEYYEVYTEISELLLRAYYDVTVYQGIIDSAVVVQRMSSESQGVISHYSDLLKDDLGLSLWKIHDKGKDVYNIHYLENYLASKYEKRQNYKYSAEINSMLENDLRQIRKVRLAHNLKNKGEASIEVSTLRKALDETRERLNKMCYPDLDDRIVPVDDAKLFALSMSAGLGVRRLLQNYKE